MNIGKAKIAISSIIQKFQMIFGVFLILFSVLIFIIIKGDMDGIDVGMIIFCFVVGGLIIWRSSENKKMINLYKTYNARLSLDSSGSINILASSLATSPDIVAENLQKLIDKGFFTNAFIDKKNNCIVFTDRITNGHINNSTPINPFSGQASNEYNVVTCKGCGGVNKIPKGKVGECEFCGTVIN